MHSSLPLTEVDFEWTKIKGDVIALMSKQKSMLLELDLKNLGHVRCST